MILLPDESKVDKTISMETLLKRRNITPDKKQKLKSTVKSLTWRNKLSDKVLPLKPSIKGLPEIEFFEIEFVGKPDLSVLRIIDEVIPYYVFFYCYNGEYTEYWVAEKEVINDKVKVYRYYHNNEGFEADTRYYYLQSFSVDQLFYDMLIAIRMTSNEAYFFSDNLKDLCKFLVTLHKRYYADEITLDVIRIIPELTRFLMLKGSGTIDQFIDYISSTECKNQDIFYKTIETTYCCPNTEKLNEDGVYHLIKETLQFLSESTFYNFDAINNTFDFSERIKLDMKIKIDLHLVRMALLSIDMYCLEFCIPTLRYMFAPPKSIPRKIKFPKII